MMTKRKVNIILTIKFILLFMFGMFVLSEETSEAVSNGKFKRAEAILESDQDILYHPIKSGKLS